MTVIIMVVGTTKYIKGNDATAAVVVVYNIDVVVDKDKNNDGDLS